MSSWAHPYARLEAIDAILWDLDGTLVDSAGATLSALSLALAGCGHDATWLTAEAVIGPRLVDTLRERGLTDTEIRHVRNRYRTEFGDHALDHIRPFEGIPKLLAALKGAGVPQSIVSNRLQEILDSICKTTGLSELVNAVVGRVAGRDSKVAVVNYAMRRLSIRAGFNVLLIGDRVEDIDIGARLGLRSIGVQWGYARDRELQIYPNCLHVDTVESLGWLLRQDAAPASR